MKVSRPVVLIDNYDSFTFNLYQYICELGFPTRVLRNDTVSVAEIARMRPRAVVISPGPGTPDSAGITLALIRELGRGIPILGVCLGHQAIGQAFGGRVIRAPKMMHGKISDIFHQKKGVFRGQSSPLQATRYHSLIVERRSLPACLEITAKTADGIIMGLRHRKLPIEGVQFHPESILTPEGKSLLRNFFRVRPGARK